MYVKNQQLFRPPHTGDRNQQTIPVKRLPKDCRTLKFHNIWSHVIETAQDLIAVHVVVISILSEFRE